MDRSAASSAPPEPLREFLVKRPETILLVEDDASVRRMAHEYLTAKGYRVLAAGTAEEATWLAAQESGPIDILVTDITLPGENGFTVAEHLSTRNPMPRNLFISGYAHDVAIFRGSFSGHFDFLQKPFSLDVLARKIRASLDRPPAL